MNKSRHIGALLTCGLAAAGMASVGLSSPAAASYGGPRPVANWLRPVEANSGTWVAVGWQSSSRVCNVRVRVDGGRRVAVDYQSRRDYTTLSHGDSLSHIRRDYSAVRVSPNFSRSGVVQLRTTIEYNECDRHSRTERRSYWLALPVQCGHSSHIVGRGSEDNWGDEYYSNGHQYNSGGHQSESGSYESNSSSHESNSSSHESSSSSHESSSSSHESSSSGHQPTGNGAQPTGSSNGYGTTPSGSAEGNGVKPTGNGVKPTPTVTPTGNAGTPGSNSQSGGGRQS